MPPAPATTVADARRAARLAALRACGADDAVAAELLAYGESPLHDAALPDEPPADEPCAAAWAAYAAEARAHGAAATLRRHLVQLRFPVAERTAESPAYQAATRRGDLAGAPTPAAWPAFVDPEGVRIAVHRTAAGALPVVVARARADFELLVRALTRRNAPAPIPPAMGAVVVGGYVNWSRVAAARRGWAAARGGDDARAWRDEGFPALAADRPRFQDRVVLLSEGPYSAVSSAAIGLPEAAWRDASLVLRLEHECAHYVTRRLFGSMRNALPDELLADHAGLVAALGRYDAAHAARFLGLDDAPPVRAGARLHAYRGDPPLSDAAFSLLARLAGRAVHAIAAFDARRARTGVAPRDALAALVALARTPTELLAAPDGAARLLAAYDAAHDELRARWGAPAGDVPAGDVPDGSPTGSALPTSSRSAAPVVGAGRARSPYHHAPSTLSGVSP